MAASIPSFMGDQFHTTLSHGLKVINGTETIHYAIPVSGNEDNLRSMLAQFWQMCTLWNVLFALFVAANLKCVPFVWHLRILNGLTRTLKAQRPPKPPTYSQIFQPLVTETQVPLLEIDFNMHKTNSSYFADIDIARSHLICTLFSQGIEYYRGGTGIFTGSNKPVFYLALGAVSCSFKRELKAYESYELWTRVLAWDEKWIYIVTHFVRKGAVEPKDYTLYPEQNIKARELSETEGEKLAELQANTDSLGSHPGVVATALSKCVFKESRRTITPALMFRRSGILPSDSEERSSARESLSGAGSESDCSNDNLCESSDSGTAVGTEEEGSVLDVIEKERARGMEVARSLSNNMQNALEMEFTGSRGSALGRHLDGAAFLALGRCGYLIARDFLKKVTRRSSTLEVTR